MEFGKRTTQRIDVSGFNRHLLMPLPKEKIRALSLEHHLALATVQTGYGTLDQLGCLTRVTYLAFYLRDIVTGDTAHDLYRHAEMALNACVKRMDCGDGCRLLEHELTALEQILVVHDAQLSATTWHHYLAAWECLRNHIATGKRSPIAVVADR